MPKTADVQERVVVKLGTKVAEANAAAVASTIQAVVAIVEEAQKQIKSTDALLVKARPFSEGSFEIPLEFILVVTDVALRHHDILSMGGHPLIDAVLKMLKDYISIRKALQGKPLPASAKDGSVVVQGNISVSNSVVNILMNSQVNTVVDKAAADVEADPTIKHVKVYRGDEEKPLVSIERKELEYFRYDKSSALEGPKREIPRPVTVVIHTTVLEGRGKWKFILEGHTITADIQDEDFMQRVRAGKEVFAAGDRLKVDLLVYEEYDEALATYQAKRHSIVKVHEHHKRPKKESPSLFAND